MATADPFAAPPAVPAVDFFFPTLFGSTLPGAHSQDRSSLPSLSSVSSAPSPVSGKLKSLSLLFSVSLKPSISSRLSPLRTPPLALPEDATNTLALSPSGDLLFVAGSEGQLLVLPLTPRGTPAGKLCQKTPPFRHTNLPSRPPSSSSPSSSFLTPVEGATGPQMSLWGVPATAEELRRRQQSGEVWSVSQRRRQRGDRNGPFVESEWESVSSSSSDAGLSEVESERGETRGRDGEDAPFLTALGEEVETGHLHSAKHLGRERAFLPERFVFLLPADRYRRPGAFSPHAVEASELDEASTWPFAARDRRVRATNIACETLAGEEVLVSTTRAGDVLVFSLAGIRERLDRERERKREEKQREREAKRRIARETKEQKEKSATEKREKEERDAGESQREANRQGAFQAASADRLERGHDADEQARDRLESLSSASSWEAHDGDSLVNALRAEARERQQEERIRQIQMEEAHRLTPVPDVWIRNSLGPPTSHSSCQTDVSTWSFACNPFPPAAAPLSSFPVCSLLLPFYSSLVFGSNTHHLSFIDLRHLPVGRGDAALSCSASLLHKRVSRSHAKDLILAAARLLAPQSSSTTWDSSSSSAALSESLESSEASRGSPAVESAERQAREGREARRHPGADTDADSDSDSEQKGEKIRETIREPLRRSKEKESSRERDERGARERQVEGEAGPSSESGPPPQMPGRRVSGRARLRPASKQSPHPTRDEEADESAGGRADGNIGRAREVSEELECLRRLCADACSWAAIAAGQEKFASSTDEDDWESNHGEARARVTEDKASEGEDGADLGASWRPGVGGQRGTRRFPSFVLPEGSTFPVVAQSRPRSPPAQWRQETNATAGLPGLAQVSPARYASPSAQAATVFAPWPRRPGMALWREAQNAASFRPSFLAFPDPNDHVDLPDAPLFVEPYVRPRWLRKRRRGLGDLPALCGDSPRKHGPVLSRRGSGPGLDAGDLRISWRRQRTGEASEASVHAAGRARAARPPAGSRRTQRDGLQAAGVGFLARPVFPRRSRAPEEAELVRRPINIRRRLFRLNLETRDADTDARRELQDDSGLRPRAHVLRNFRPTPSASSFRPALPSSSNALPSRALSSGALSSRPSLLDRSVAEALTPLLSLLRAGAPESGEETRAVRDSLTVSEIARTLLNRPERVFVYTPPLSRPGSTEAATAQSPSSGGGLQRRMHAVLPQQLGDAEASAREQGGRREEGENRENEEEPREDGEHGEEPREDAGSRENGGFGVRDAGAEHGQRPAREPGVCTAQQSPASVSPRSASASSPAPLGRPFHTADVSRSTVFAGAGEARSETTQLLTSFSSSGSSSAASSAVANLSSREGRRECENPGQGERIERDDAGQRLRSFESLAAHAAAAAAASPSVTVAGAGRGDTGREGTGREGEDGGRRGPAAGPASRDAHSAQSEREPDGETDPDGRERRQRVPEGEAREEGDERAGFLTRGEERESRQEDPGDALSDRAWGRIWRTLTARIGLADARERNVDESSDESRSPRERRQALDWVEVPAALVDFLSVYLYRCNVPLVAASLLLHAAALGHLSPPLSPAALLPFRPSLPGRQPRRGLALTRNGARLSPFVSLSPLVPSIREAEEKKEKNEEEEKKEEGEEEEKKEEGEEEEKKEEGEEEEKKEEGEGEEKKEKKEEGEEEEKKEKKEEGEEEKDRECHEKATEFVGGLASSGARREVISCARRDSGLLSFRGASCSIDASIRLIRAQPPSLPSRSSLPPSSFSLLCPSLGRGEEPRRRDEAERGRVGARKARRERPGRGRRAEEKGTQKLASRRCGGDTSNGTAQSNKARGQKENEPAMGDLLAIHQISGWAWSVAWLDLRNLGTLDWDQLFDLSLPCAPPPASAAAGRPIRALASSAARLPDETEAFQLAGDPAGTSRDDAESPRNQAGDMKVVDSETPREPEQPDRVMREAEDNTCGEDVCEEEVWEKEQIRRDEEARWRQTAIRSLLAAGEPTLRSALVDRALLDALQRAAQNFHAETEDPPFSAGRGGLSETWTKESDDFNGAEAREGWEGEGENKVGDRRGTGLHSRSLNATRPAIRLRGDVSSDSEYTEDGRRPEAEAAGHSSSEAVRSSEFQLSGAEASETGRDRDRPVKRRKGDARLETDTDTVGAEALGRRRPRTETLEQATVVRWTADTAESVASALASQQEQLQRDSRELLEDVGRNFDACARTHTASASAILNVDPHALVADGALVEEIKTVVAGLHRQRAELVEWQSVIRAVNAEVPSSFSAAVSFPSSVPLLSPSSASALGEALSRARLQLAGFQRERSRAHGCRGAVEASGPVISERVSRIQAFLEAQRHHATGERELGVSFQAFLEAGEGERQQTHQLKCDAAPEERRQREATETGAGGGARDETGGEGERRGGGGRRRPESAEREGHGAKDESPLKGKSGAFERREMHDGEHSAPGSSTLSAASREAANPPHPSFLSPEGEAASAVVDAVVSVASRRGQAVAFENSRHIPGPSPGAPSPSPCPTRSPFLRRTEEDGVEERTPGDAENAGHDGAMWRRRLEPFLLLPQSEDATPLPALHGTPAKRASTPIPVSASLPSSPSSSMPSGASPVSASVPSAAGVPVSSRVRAAAETDRPRQAQQARPAFRVSPGLPAVFHQTQGERLRSGLLSRLRFLPANRTVRAGAFGRRERTRRAVLGTINAEEKSRLVAQLLVATGERSLVLLRPRFELVEEAANSPAETEPGVEGQARGEETDRGAPSAQLFCGETAGVDAAVGRRLLDWTVLKSRENAVVGTLATTAQTTDLPRDASADPSSPPSSSPFTSSCPSSSDSRRWRVALEEVASIPDVFPSGHASDFQRLCFLRTIEAAGLIVCAFQHGGPVLVYAVEKCPLTQGLFLRAVAMCMGVDAVLRHLPEELRNRSVEDRLLFVPATPQGSGVDSSRISGFAVWHQSLGVGETPAALETACLSRGRERSGTRRLDQDLHPDCLSHSPVLRIFVRCAVGSPGAHRSFGALWVVRLRPGRETRGAEERLRGKLSPVRLRERRVSLPQRGSNRCASPRCTFLR
ncbi:conserved hypothetical protein [Neospora caninum Liverpool]|uniref:Uncharacterized protein n=1 Tax=Neospora caninum (strain Liverpool) TaxID=572307 RepID=F0VL31_NEOCL|nr:conserved hypothetical protein [Neospora caninum Liverpool]CBZ54783.1 conserved hypothetical protein [Neospora caninum Liverpool]|eukprot:XP_003884811.1 conserved hypothetical protein [Neospora caninum Liverpool]